MIKGVIIHLDNDRDGILLPAENLFKQMGIDLDYILCSSKEEFNSALIKYKTNLRGLIFDLLSQEPDKGELIDYDPEFLNDIQQTFEGFNTPIFIYSGYLHALNDRFENNGTIFKIDKNEGIEPIFTKIKLFYESGFLDVFCPGGVLETQIHKDLHDSFINQFNDNTQIEAIITQIKSTMLGVDYSERVKGIFKRIAVKSLMFDLLSPIADDGDTVNSIEHFYKRNNKIPVWTGDIWINNDSTEKLFILTPRCDLANGKAKELIVCKIVDKNLNLKSDKDKPGRLKQLRDFLTDNVSSKSTRYIPDTPFLKGGGFVELASYRTITKNTLMDTYKYHVTLSDDLTNEILGKFASYFLRTGISTINAQELDSYLSLL